MPSVLIVLDVVCDDSCSHGLLFSFLFRGSKWTQLEGDSICEVSGVHLAWVAMLA